MALLEAMASGAACVASDVGGVGELLGPAGKLVQSGDEDALYQAVEMLLDDESQRRELGEKARRRVVDNYDIRAWGGKIEDAYRSVHAWKNSG
jgi:glycosyltransferase involved in cell wall biosynthesis